MADYTNIVKQIVTVDAFGWDDLLAPATMSRVRLKNTGIVDVKVRTNANDATTEDVIPVGGVEDLNPWRQAAWAARDVVCALQADSGVGTVVVTWSA